LRWIRLTKVEWLVVVGAIALVTALLTVLWPVKPAESKWSKASNGVQVMLCSTHFHYKVGETIKIYVKFRNVGKTSQTIKTPSLYATINMSCNRKAFADAIGAYPEGIDELKLLPGQTSKNLFLDACRTDNEGAGIYEFSGGMGNEEQWHWIFESLRVKVSRWF